jgi:hypothetical protein
MFTQLPQEEQPLQSQPWESRIVSQLMKLATK